MQIRWSNSRNWPNSFLKSHVYRDVEISLIIIFLISEEKKKEVEVGKKDGLAALEALSSVSAARFFPFPFLHSRFFQGLF